MMDSIKKAFVSSGRALKLFYVIAETYHNMKDWGQAISWGQKALYADPGNEQHKKLLQKLVDKIGH